MTLLTRCCIGSITNAGLLSVWIVQSLIRPDLRSEDQRTLDPDIVHNGTAEVAAHNHETERQSIASVDEMGRLGSSCAE